VQNKNKASRQFRLWLSAHLNRQHLERDELGACATNGSTTHYLYLLR